MVHWVTWIAVSLACGAAAFITAEAIPFFGSLLGLLGAIAYAPMAVSASLVYRAHTRLSSRCICGCTTMAIDGGKGSEASASGRST